MRLQRLDDIHDRRRETLEHLAQMGVNDGFISDLVEEFYGRVRADESLGPIFASEIGDQWDPHLKKMKEFWSSIILKTNRYSGKPVPAHQKLGGVTPLHFQRWLELFVETLEGLTDDKRVVELFLRQAKQIAARLESVMELSHE